MPGNIKKQILKRILMVAAPSMGILLPVIIGAVIVFVGIAAVVSTRDTVEKLHISELDTAEELRTALKKRRVSDEDLDDMMIDRKGLIKILDETIKWNNGEWQTSDRLKISLSEKTDDHYYKTNVVSKDISEYVRGYAPSEFNYGVVTYEKVVDDTSKPPQVVLAPNAKGVLQPVKITFEKKTITRRDTVGFWHRYSKKITSNGEEKYVLDTYGDYIKLSEGYGLLDTSTIYHYTDFTHYETYTTEYSVTFSAPRNKRITQKTEVLGQSYTAFQWLDALTNGPTWKVVVGTEDLYKDYPVDWQLIYLLSVYKYIDEHDMEDVPSDYEEDGATETVKIKKKEVEELIEACMPKFEYASVSGGMSSVFDALYRNSTQLGLTSFVSALSNMRNAWLQKNIAIYNKLDKSGIDIMLTSEQVKNLYSSANATNNVLLRGGEPIEVTVFWTKENEYNIVADGSYGYRTDYSTPIIHTSTIYVPYSSISSVSTIVADYFYDSAQITKHYAFDISKSQNQAGTQLGAGDWQELEEKLSDLATQRTAVPVDSRFNLTRLRDLLGEDRDADGLLSALEEVPGGEKLVQALKCAIEYEGTDKTVDEAVYEYNRNNSDGVVPGTLGIKATSRY